jgi:hypothetical protein
MSELGVKETQIRGFAEKAFALKRLMRESLREVTLEVLEGILWAAL